MLLSDRFPPLLPLFENHLFLHVLRVLRIISTKGIELILDEHVDMAILLFEIHSSSLSYFSLIPELVRHGR